MSRKKTGKIWVISDDTNYARKMVSILKAHAHQSHGCPYDRMSKPCPKHPKEQRQMTCEECWNRWIDKNIEVVDDE